MKNRISRPLATLVTIALCASPFIASAQSASSSDTLGGIAAQIQTLLQQIQTLKTQIMQLQGQAFHIVTSNMGSSTPMRGCRQFAEDMHIGSSGEDVREFQHMLARDSSLFSDSNATGFFGPLTARAVSKLQEKFGIASTSTGFVGPRTRKFIQEHCDKIHDEGEDDEDNGEMMMGSTSPFIKRPELSGDNNRGVGGGGMVTAVGSSTVTVQGPNGVIKTLTITSATQIQVFDQLSRQFVLGSISSVVVGQMVTANVMLNPDGTVTALVIRVGVPPPMMGSGDH